MGSSSKVTWGGRGENKNPLSDVKYGVASSPYKIGLIFLIVIRKLPALGAQVLGLVTTEEFFPDYKLLTTNFWLYTHL